MKREFSAGAMIFYDKNNTLFYLLLKDGYNHWTFPKGNIEKGEHAPQTAKREIVEETGLKKIEFILGFKEYSQYIYKLKSELVFKKVTWFLVRSFTKKVRLSDEHTDYSWLPLQEAISMIDIQDNKILLKKAAEHLANPQINFPAM